MPRKNIHHELEVATGNVVRLRHVTRQGDWRFYHYEGEMPVVDGVLTIPADMPEVVKRAWIQGFRMTAGGRVIADLAKHIRAEAVAAGALEDDSCCSDECCTGTDKPCCDESGCCVGCDAGECIPTVSVTPVDETENAKSDEETDTDEGAVDGGLPVEDDGVRASEPDRDGSLPEGGDDGRGGDEPAGEGAGDEPAD